MRWFAPAFGLGTVAAATVLLEALVGMDVVSRYVVPLPTEVIGALPRVFVDENVPARFLLTSAETLAAGVLITVAGVPAGFWLHHSPGMRRAFEPWVAAWAAAPLVLAYPLFLVLFGRSPVAIAILGFAAGVAPVVLNTVEGLSGMSLVLMHVGQSLQATPWQMFRKILLPAALPSIFTGLRLGLTFGLINIVGVEFLVNFGGLGQLINELSERFDLPGTYAAVLFVVLTSVLFFVLLEHAERWLRHDRV